MTTYSYRWQQLRRVFLLQHPTCAMCAERGRLTAATVADHVTPHRGDPALFWDTDNLQALCSPCHNRHKQRQEKSGAVPGCDAQGFPLDPSSPWYRGQKALN